MPTSTLRRGVMADAAALAELGERTFRETFQDSNTAEDLAAYLSLAFGVPQQSAELHDPDYVTLLLEDDGQLAAFAQVRRHETPECIGDQSSIELYRFYVDRPWHGYGLAQQLMEAVREVARERGAKLLWLGVWEHNERALRFYKKCGFRDVGSHVFVVGSDPQTDRIMMTEV